MTVGLLACLTLTVAGFIWLLDRKDKRAHLERDRHREETQVLLQRIQAPDVAVVAHDVDRTVGAPQPPVSDDAYWELSREHAEAVAALEARENAIFER
jgi:hypothetical protein